MRSQLNKQIQSIFLSAAVLLQGTLSANPNTAERVAWAAVETNTSASGVPSNLKYFQYYDTLPDEIVQPIYKNMELSSLAGKKLFVGYGTVDPDGNACRYFPELGRTECFPWWRIEREYSVPDENASSAVDFIKNLTLIYPPKNIQYCRQWKTNEQIEAGKVTCTSYYDKRLSVDCLADPMQSECYVDECSDGIKSQCTLVGTYEGDTTTLVRPIVGSDGAPIGADMIVGLKTSQYNCPAGYLPAKQCADTLYASTYPYECKAPTSVSARDGEYVYCDKNPQPFYDNTGALVGFTSDDQCSDGAILDGGINANGKPRMCLVNNYQQTQKVCDDPIIQVESTVASQTITQKRTFKDYETSVVFGDEVGDIYAGDPMCLRLNDIEGARQQKITAHISGSGYLDDDIYLIAHKANGSYNKIYCNMQHNESSSGNAKKWVYEFSGFTSVGAKTIKATLTYDTGEIATVSKSVNVLASGGLNNGYVDISAAGAMSVDKNVKFTTAVFSGSTVTSVSFEYGDFTQRAASLDSSTSAMVNKNYAGDTLQCIDNDGNYNFNQDVELSATDVVSIQQASEAENTSKELMFARNHYRSTAVGIDGVAAAPATFPSTHPAYPTHAGMFLKTWDNALSTLSIMFPFAGAYEIFVYGGSNEGENRLLGGATLTIDDFKNMPKNSYLQLKLGKTMSLADGIPDGDKSAACREDDFVEWGGGVWSSPSGSKGDMSGCSAPNDSYAKQNSAYNIVVKDLLTGSVTPIHLVYPLPYPNRIFISRLNVVENRKYRCYDQWPELGLGEGCTIGSQNESMPASDYRGSSVNLQRSSTIYCDVATEKVVGCNSERTIQRSGGVEMAGFNEYETRDNSGMFMNALAGAQLSEQMMHIWSGWPGECESGIFSDFSWTTDPMTLASLAMSAWSSMNASAANAASAGEEAGEAFEGLEQADAASGGAEASAATSIVNEGVQAGKSLAEIAASYTGESARISAYLNALAKAEYWSSALGTELVNAVTATTSQVTNGLSSIVASATQEASSLASGVTTSGPLSEISAHLNDAIAFAQTSYDNTFNVTGAMQKLQDELIAYGEALQRTSDPEVTASINRAMTDTANEYAKLQSSLSGNIATVSSTLERSVASLFSDPNTADPAMLAAKNTAADSYFRTIQQDVRGFFSKVEEINNLTDVGFHTIKWTDIAAAGYSMYENVEAKKDEMIKAWKAQQAYVMSGAGTNNDIASNAYASCMASLGSSFINTVSIASGARDANATSQELLTPEHNPLRISFQSLYELKQIVGEEFLEMSYMIRDIDYNMQMVTIVALNSAAYTQLAQEVCGGYQVAALGNALNQQASQADPNMMDALANMTPMQAAKMAASAACSLAGPYAFACSLGMKVLGSFSSGNACTDEKIAQSQKPIQLKTNRFQKFGQCHFVTQSCSKKVLGKCMLKKYHYCCYDQIMTRIFAEGVKAQRGTGWGSCNDITINDLKDISFTPCEPGQDPQASRCFPLEQYRELNGELKKQIKKGFAADGDTFMQQVQNAMEITQ